MTPLRLLQWNGAKAWAGAEVRLVEVCRHLIARGHMVTGVARDGGPLLGHLREVGVPAAALAPHGAADLPRMARVAWLARRLKVDVIHAHAGRDYVPAIVASRLARRPLVLHRHLALPQKPSSARLVARHAGAVIAVSTPVQESLVARDGVPAARVFRIPMLVDPARSAVASGAAERVRRELGAGEKLLVVSVGHLHPSKGHDDLIRAAALLRERGLGFLLAIAGDGPERERLECLVGELRLSAQVRLLGARDDVPALIAACDCFALLSWEDPFPGAILEAMGAGKPVVACAAGGVPEMVGENETGLLVPAHGVIQAAEALARVLADRDLARRLGAAGQHRAATQFSYEGMLEAWEAVYARVLRH